MNAKRSTRPVRILTAVPICDGHDSPINTINLEFIRHGIEVIYLGYHRSARDIVRAAIQEDVRAIGLSSYNGGHVEFRSQPRIHPARYRGHLPRLPPQRPRHRPRRDSGRRARHRPFQLQRRPRRVQIGTSNSSGTVSRSSTSATTAAPATSSAPRFRKTCAPSAFPATTAATSSSDRNLEFIRHGIEVIYLGYHRSARDIVRAAIQEDVRAIGLSSYNGGHVEFFGEVVQLLRKHG